MLEPKILTTYVFVQLRKLQFSSPVLLWNIIINIVHAHTHTVVSDGALAYDTDAMVLINDLNS